MSFDALKEIVADVGLTSDALAPLIQDEPGFELLVQSFRAQDRDTFQAVPGRHGLLERIELVCEWICIRYCTRICLDFCDLPVFEEPVVRLAEVGAALRDLAGKPGGLEALAAAVLEEDAGAFRRVIDEFGLQRYCHHLCYWVCWTRCRLVCRVLSAAQPPGHIVSCNRLVGELRQSADAAVALMREPEVVERVEKAMLAQDYAAVRDLLQVPALVPLCQRICILIRVWRCVRICRLVCHPFPHKPKEPFVKHLVAEARLLHEAAGQIEALQGLVRALGRDDPDALREHIEALRMQAYCFPFCQWICGLWFRRFCFWLCPVRPFRPWFTHVGHFHINGDIDSGPAGTGRTKHAVLGHGGPDYGFFGCLELRGFCPATSPLSGGGAMRYRFLYETADGVRLPVVPALVCAVSVGSRRIFWKENSNSFEETFQTIRIAGSGATPDPTPQPAGPGPWGPPPAHVIVPDGDGWIPVDPQALGGGFNGALIGLNSRALHPGGPPNPGVAAGQQIPAANLRDGIDLRVVFEATRVAGPMTPPDHTNALQKLHVNNWDEVPLIDIAEFHTGGGTRCSPLSSTLGVEYSVDHARMAAWSIDIVTAAPVTPPALPGGTSTRGAGLHSAFGVQTVDISAWPSCSYTLRLHARRALTTGLVDDDADSYPVTFCIGPRG